jgi:hypothetical protein
VQLRPAAPRQEQNSKKYGGARQAQLRQPHGAKTVHSLFSSHNVRSPKHRPQEHQNVHQGMAVAMAPD